MKNLNIAIVSPNIFKQTTKNFKEVSPCPLYTLLDGIASKENKYTMGGNTCSIIAMNNGKSTYLGHFAPEFRELSFKQKLDNIIRKFKAQTGELSAIVTGGYDYKVPANNKEAIKSFEQIAEIGEILDKNNAHLTMIACKTNPIFTDNLAVTNDEFILSHSPKTGGNIPTRKLTSNTSTEELEDLLNNEYSIVEIDPLHTIIFGG